MEITSEQLDELRSAAQAAEEKKERDRKAAEAAAKADLEDRKAEATRALAKVVNVAMEVTSAYGNGDIFGNATYAGETFYYRVVEGTVYRLLAEPVEYEAEEESWIDGIVIKDASDLLQYIEKKMAAAVADTTA